VLGRGAAGLLPLDAIAGSPSRVPWGWQSAALARSLGAAEPMLARDGRAVLLCEPSGEEAVVAAALGGIGAGYRLVSTRLAEPGDDAALVEFVRPGAAIPPGPRSRANVALPAVTGGAGDPDLVPGRGLFAPPERYENRPSRRRAALTDAAGCQAGAAGPHRRLLGRSSSGDRPTLRHLSPGGSPDGAPGTGPAPRPGRASPAAPRHPRHHPRRLPAVRPRPLRPASAAEGAPPPDADPETAATPASAPTFASDATAGLWTERPRDEDVAAGQVERLLALIHDELGRAGHRRLTEIETGRWWLADRADREAAAVPLADRVEWAVFSLLSTAGPLSEVTFLERIAGLFPGHDLPDETLVRACLASYRSLASTPDRLVTADDLLHRTQEHTETLALLAELGHALGLRVWLNRREQERMVRGHRLSEWMDARERSVHLPLIAKAPGDDLADVDVIWYVRGKATFHFEVEWTAMLSEPVLRRHARIPADERTVRFLVVVPERTELIRHKLERSPVLRCAGRRRLAHLKSTTCAFAASRMDRSRSQAFLGLDPLVERSGEQLPLFEG
jgi:hypothetical protein